MDPKVATASERVLADSQAMFTPDLISLVLYGSAAGENFVPGKSDLNFAIVVRQVGFAHLQALAEQLPHWHRLDVATPLLIDLTFLDRARDVFPMEILDIQAEHRVLYGADVFTALEVDLGHLRYQLEQEARGKLLRLRMQFAESGGTRARVEELMLASVQTFLVLMRSVLRVRREPTPPLSLQLLDRFENELEVPLPTVREVLEFKHAGRKWARAVNETFADYLADIERLVELIDRSTGFARDHAD